ncbi:MAG: hypothetical protein ACREDR_03725 [Blastocatellia bacterium]
MNQIFEAHDVIICKTHHLSQAGNDRLAQAGDFEQFHTRVVFPGNSVPISRVDEHSLLVRFLPREFLPLALGRKFGRARILLCMTFERLEGELRPLFDQLASLQEEIRDKLLCYADGKYPKGDELVGWLGEIYGKLLCDGVLVDDSVDHDRALC